MSENIEMKYWALYFIEEISKKVTDESETSDDIQLFKKGHEKLTISSAIDINKCLKMNETDENYDIYDLDYQIYRDELVDYCRDLLLDFQYDFEKYENLGDD